MAHTAWQFFVTAYQEDTGLVNAVGSFPSTTMWDTASYVSALVSAYELRIIDKREFDRRAFKLLGTLRNLDLFRNEMPNKVYHTQTGEKVNYANEAGEIGFSALDIGRLMVWLKIVKERYPYLANSVDGIPMRWNFCNTVAEDGRLFGASVDGEGKTRYYQEGRLGYEEYAAKGFALWGFDTQGALDAQPFDYEHIHGVAVPYDARDPRIFGTKNYVLTESYLLDGLELGWDRADEEETGPGLASHGWRAEFAHRVFYVQQRRFEEKGILTARSEHQVNGEPFFVYDSIFADGYAWNTLDTSGEYQPDRAAISAKAAIGMWALWDSPYTDLLFESVADLSVPDAGFQEGIYENGNGAIPLQSANNNGIILAALLHKEQGKILRFQNNNTDLWDTAFEFMDTRKNRCLPQPKTVACPCDIDPPSPEPIGPDDYIFCLPVETRFGFGASNCAVPELVLAKKPVPQPLPVCRPEGEATCEGGPAK